MKRVGKCRLAGEDRLVGVVGDGNSAGQNEKSGKQRLHAERKTHETSQEKLAAVRD
jgi:hypothetical protein